MCVHFERRFRVILGVSIDFLEHEHPGVERLALLIARHQIYSSCRCKVANGDPIHIAAKPDLPRCRCKVANGAPIHIAAKPDLPRCRCKVANGDPIHIAAKPDLPPCASSWPMS